MNLKPARNYKGSRYPTLRKYYGRKHRNTAIRAIALAGAMTALASISGCFPIGMS